MEQKSPPIQFVEGRGVAHGGEHNVTFTVPGAPVCGIRREVIRNGV